MAELSLDRTHTALLIADFYARPQVLSSGCSASGGLTLCPIRLTLAPLSASGRKRLL